jgi:hypothetical protein
MFRTLSGNASWSWLPCLVLGAKKIATMAVKPTKRKAFNFLRSYFDVFNELKDPKDKLDFLEAIINKQFLDEDPKELSFLPNLCYESQRHSIETSVNGWKRASKTDLLGNPLTTPPTPLGSNPSTPLEEEEEKEEVQEEEEEETKVNPKESFFNIFWTKYPNKVAKDKCKTKFLKLPQKDIDTILETIDTFVNNKPFKDYTHPNPYTYLNQKRWLDEASTAKPKSGHETSNDPHYYKHLDTLTERLNREKEQYKHLENK